MATYQFTIRLTSDAEPGTGLGGELINDLIPRNHERQPIISASHVKGLMRAHFQDFAELLEWDDDLETLVFGGHDLPEDSSKVGVEAAFQLKDAVAVGMPQTRLVTRTAVEHTGVAKTASLRTTEAIPVGTEFKGEIHTCVPQGCAEDVAWRLTLLSVAAIGGGRNRGCGACVVEIAGEDRTPGQLLRELDATLQNESWRNAGLASRTSQHSLRVAKPPLSDKPVVLRLVFRATTPICCPEIPDKTNVITTGFSIPASAVQGALLHRLNTLDSALATALFESASFRTWPLHPCLAPSGAIGEIAEGELPQATRVSLTHRVAKFSEPQGYEEKHFFDEAVETDAYDWRKIADGTPLKASDGVLLRWQDGKVLLWKAASMPHVVTAHGVHSDPASENGRNLFTIDAMAPLVWQGLAVMPGDAAKQLQASLKKDAVVAIGKSRSVRGLGELEAVLVEGVPEEWRTRTDRTVLVVQSPLLLSDRPADGVTAEDEFSRIATEWACKHGLPPLSDKGVWANVGIRFGWNRHAKGRQRACRVILPGSVVAFSTKIDDNQLTDVLKNHGMGMEARQRGFGAVTVHPGKAVGLYAQTPKPQTLAHDGSNKLRDAIQLVLEMQRTAERLPSPSQIRAVQQRADKSGSEEAIRYLEHQTKRTSRIWYTWERIYENMRRLLSTCDGKTASQALEVLANLAIVSEKKEARP